MYRRSLILIVVALTLTLALTACGGTREGESNIVPEYSGGTAVTAPDTFKNEMTSSLKNVKDGTFEAYKTGDSQDKVKAFFTEQFKEKGWTNKSSEIGNNTKGLETQVQGFTLIFEKGNRAAEVIGFPGTQATTLGFKDLAPSDTFYLVVHGVRQ